MKPLRVCALVSLVSLAQCAGARPAPVAATPSTTTTGRTAFSAHDGPRNIPPEPVAYAAAAPLFARYCVDCHSAAGPRHDAEAYSELAMDHYPFTGRFGALAGLAVAEVIGATGRVPSMPTDHPGILVGNELKTVMTWAEAFHLVHPLPEHPSVPPRAAR